MEKLSVFGPEMVGKEWKVPIPHDNKKSTMRGQSRGAKSRDRKNRTLALVERMKKEGWG